MRLNILLFDKRGNMKFFKYHIIFILTLSISPVLNCNNIVGDGSSFQTIDHTSVDKTMSDPEIISARNEKIYFEHASVGGNISSGLDALALSDSRYSRTNFVFNARGNFAISGDKIDLFYNNLTSNTPNPSLYTSLMFKFCYIDNGGDMAALFAHVRGHMETLESLFPSKIFVWWTMPLQTTGDANRDLYNSLVRNYCRNNNKILFDLADIESHDPAGNPIIQGGYEAMYPAYSSDGGHLNSTGYNRVAKAFWQLALRISQQ